MHKVFWKKSAKKVESDVADSTNDALDAFFDPLSSGGEIDANESFACRLTVHRAWIDPDFGMAEQVVSHFLRCPSCGTDVKP